MKISNIGEIILTNDIVFEIENLKNNYSNHRIFFENSFKIENAKAVINECHISSNTLKYVIIAGDNFNQQAQNTLLKLLEEPPENIKLILITKSKNSILPTILSRMIIFNKKMPSQKEEFDISLNSLTLASIVDFTKDLNYLSKEQARKKIENLLFDVKNSNIKLNSDELDCFSDAISQIEYGTNARFVFLVLLLMILENKRRKNKF